MNLSSVFIAVVLLGIERLFYAWVWRFPDAFRNLCARSGLAFLGDAAEALQKFFYLFKGLQLAVFFGWFYIYGHGSISRPSYSLIALAIGVVLILFGQLLNFSVFYRLGKIGVFYGSKFGYYVPWCRGFPFSLFRHPQYVGAVLSIWGIFLMMRFPYNDWYILPIIETGYYILGAYMER